MPERTIRFVFYNYEDENGSIRTAHRGETVDLSEAEIARGEAFGAFEGSADTEPGGAGDSGSEGVVPSELTDEQIDDLSGSALDDACEMAGIDTTTGGSLSNGGLSAAEKRDALRAFRDGNS